MFHELYTIGGSASPMTVGPGGEVVGSFVGDHTAGTGAYPMIWNSANPNGIYLESIDTSGGIYGTDGSHQVGFVSGTDNNGVQYIHATIWSGQPSTAANLNPTPFVVGVPAPWVDSFAEAVSSSQQVGFGCPNGCVGGQPQYALLWSGTKESFVNLNPTGFDDSYAIGVQGGQQVGAALKAGSSHALLWTGSADSAVDLNPQGNNTISQAYATDGRQQVGDAYENGAYHAFLWMGTADSAVDLGPGAAYAVGGGKQVGLAGNFNYTGDVTVWSGSAASALDLNPLLPSTYSVFGSGGNVSDPIKSLYIDPSGNIFGVAYDVTTGIYHAFELEAIAPNGDYNYDGIVDARDYVVWRAGFGTKYDMADYQAWRANFGRTISSGVALSAVPEPRTLWMLCEAILTTAIRHSRARHS